LQLPPQRDKVAAEGADMLHRILAWAFAAALTLFAPAPAFADEAERLALARQIIATRSDEAELQFFEATLPYYLYNLEQATALTEAERARLPDMLREEYLEALELSREHSAATFARIFTEAELREILDFYKSDAGRRFLANQTELQEDSLALQQAMNIAVMEGALERLLESRTAQHF
jgi:hypothetical protein